jgi:hypothetical protein
VEARPTKRLGLFGVRRLRRRFRVLHPSPIRHPSFLSRAGGFVEARPTKSQTKFPIPETSNAPKFRTIVSSPSIHSYQAQKTRPCAPSFVSQQGRRFCGSSTNETPQSFWSAAALPPLSRPTPAADPPSFVSQQGGRFCGSSANETPRSFWSAAALPPLSRPTPVADPHLPARHAAHHRPALAVIQRSAATKDLSPPLPFSVPSRFSPCQCSRSRI